MELCCSNSHKKNILRNKKLISPVRWTVNCGCSYDQFLQVQTNPGFPISGAYIWHVYDQYQTQQWLTLQMQHCLTFDTAFSGLIQKLTLPMGICFIVMSQLYRKSPSSSVFSSTSWSSILLISTNHSRI